MKTYIIKVIDYIKRNYRLLFYKKHDSDNYPVVCTHCGHNEFKEINHDYIANHTCEYDIVCNRCKTINGFYHYGSFCHINNKLT